jgi:SAM-dependent methyltransferase
MPVKKVLGLCKRAAVSLRARGLRTTVEAMIATLGHYWFDVRYGTDTSEPVRLAGLLISSPNKARGVDYSATKPRVFARFMKPVRAPPGSVFVDLGCGKGRVLLLAANHGFKSVVGVEFSPELCRTARSNIAAYRRLISPSTEFEIIEGDVSDYQMRDDETVFFLFNPFDAMVMTAVLDKIEASCQRNPRPIWLIYYNPVCRDVVERRSTFRTVSEVKYAGSQAWIYTTQGPIPSSR